jgi:hypothetical protein
MSSPAHKIRIGALQATTWRNRAERGNWYSVKLIRIVANRQADRVQIFFDDKPAEETRAALKGEGWNWSRSEAEWQRKLTDAAKASAKRIVGLG